MTEVGGYAGGCAGMAMQGSQGREQLKGARAWLGTAPRRRSGKVQANVLGTLVVIGPSSDKIRQKIIGRGCAGGDSLLRCGIRGFHDGRPAFAMFRQPARQHRERATT